MGVRARTVVWVRRGEWGPVVGMRERGPVVGMRERGPVVGPVVGMRFDPVISYPQLDGSGARARARAPWGGCGGAARAGRGLAGEIGRVTGEALHLYII